MSNEAKAPAKRKDGRSPWRSSEARKLLKKDLDDGVVPLETENSVVSNEQIYLQRPQYAEWTFKEFDKYLKSLRNIVKKEKQKAEEVKEWRFSEARKLLLDDLKSNRVSRDVTANDAEQVYIKRPEFMKYEFDKFLGYLKSLREIVNKKQSNSDRDAAAYQKDRLIHPIRSHNSRGEPRWAGSEAERLLALDLKDGLLDQFQSKMDFHASRAEYRQFGLTKFRKHIHQKQRTDKFVAYYSDRKRREEAEEEGNDLT